MDNVSMGGGLKAVVYCSYTGHAKKCAEMFSNRLGVPCYDIKDIRGLDRNSKIVFFGWIRANKIMGYRKAKGIFDIKLVCGVGMCKGTDSIIQSLIERNNIDKPFYYVQGGVNTERLSGVYKWILNIVRFGIGKAVNQGVSQDESFDSKAQAEYEDNKELLKDIQNNRDHITDSAVEELVKYYQALK